MGGVGYCGIADVSAFHHVQSQGYAEKVPCGFSSAVRQNGGPDKEKCLVVRMGRKSECSLFLHF